MKAGKIKVPKTAKELKFRLNEVENDDSIRAMKYDLQIALIKSFAKQYANKVSRDKCDGCVFSYHNKSKGSHDVEDLYKEQEEQ